MTTIPAPDDSVALAAMTDDELAGEVHAAVYGTPWGPALRYAVTALRRGEAIDPAHPAVRDWMRTLSSGQRYKALRTLGDAAEEFIEEEDERLASAWASRPARMPQSAADLLACLHGKAALRGKRGGSAVLLTNKNAVAMIERLTGRAYDPRIMSRARIELERRGLVTVEVGTQWRRGTNAKGTVYNLLLDCPNALRGDTHTAADDRPRWSEADADFFESLVTASAEKKRADLLTTGSSRSAPDTTRKKKKAEKVRVGKVRKTRLLKQPCRRLCARCSWPVFWKAGEVHVGPTCSFCGELKWDRRRKEYAPWPDLGPETEPGPAWPVQPDEDVYAQLFALFDMTPAPAAALSGRKMTFDELQRACQIMLKERQERQAAGLDLTFDELMASRGLMDVSERR